MKNSHFLIFIILFIFWGESYSQEIISSENIADLRGAVELEREGTYKIDMTGTRGWVNDFVKTELEKKLKEKNSIYLIKKCSTKDALSFSISYNKPSLQLVIFKYNYAAGEHNNLNLTNMKLVYLSTDPHASYSNVKNDVDAVVPSFDCVKGEAFLIIINNIQSSYDRVTVSLENTVKDRATLIKDRTKIIDDRLPDDPVSIRIKYYDEDSGLPVISSVNLLSKKKNALYVGSEIILGSDAKTKIQLKSDAEGYFFMDTTLNLSEVKDTTIGIPLQSISVGKAIKIDKIEFVSGTASLMPGAENILRRVKDFLILNSEVKIEIQGHVNNDSKDSKSTMKLSKKRAEVIRKYFINAGINKDRMVAKGYGNTRPIFVSPKNSAEQQANRRVEIRIIK